MWIPERGDWPLIECILIAITSLPLALRMVPPNPFYGFRTPFTGSDPAVWYAANAFVGRALLAGSTVSAVALACSTGRLDGAWSAVAIVNVPAALATLAGFFYLRHLRETAQRR